LAVEDAGVVVVVVLDVLEDVLDGVLAGTAGGAAAGVAEAVDVGWPGAGDAAAFFSPAVETGVSLSADGFILSE
jgi:hypothetical protein